MKITPELSDLFNAINSVIYRSGNAELTVIPQIALEHSQEGGIHRVRLMDALSAAVNGRDRPAKTEHMSSKPWYSDTEKFIEVAQMAIANFQRN